jgi:DNA glycosylase AlkZ-like
VVGAVSRVVGLQAQDTRAARLAVRVRTRGLTVADVDGAVAGRGVVRTWAMRGTLHMLAKEDLAWIVGLLGPYFARRLAPRRRQLGLDEGTCERGLEAMETVLGKETPLTRAQIVERIAEHGVHLDPRSQGPAHLLAYGAMSGLIRRGPEAAKDEPTYELSESASEPITQEKGVKRLAERYLTGYGPATAEDFAAWSGLPLGFGRSGLEAVGPDRVMVDGRAAYSLPGAEVNSSQNTEVRLLGHFDTYLLGYRTRKLAVPAEHDRKVQAGGGFINPVVLVDGQAVGMWRQVRRKGRIEISVEPWTAIPRGLRDEVDDLGRFLGSPVDWDFPTSKG